MKIISIAIAIPLYPLFTGEELEMQEDCELAVVTLLVRCKTMFKQLYPSPC